MRNLINIFRAALPLLALGLILGYGPYLHAQWLPRLTIDEGGVGEDIQIMIHQDGSLSDTVWSANMEGGVFRSAWDENCWGDWEEFLPGVPKYGLDAVCINGTEHVLVASGRGAGQIGSGPTALDVGGGVLYAEDPTLSSDWDRPGGDEDYPDNWRHAFTQDVAFYCPQDCTWSDPENLYFVSLGGDLVSPSVTMGLYRWRGSPYNRYDRVDAGTEAHSFQHFWRDLEDPNILYTIRNGTSLWKLHGSYTSLSLDSVAIASNVAAVLGFNQWKEGEDLYSYVLVNWTPTGGSPRHSLFVSTDVASDHPSFTWNRDVDPASYTSIHSNPIK